MKLYVSRANHGNFGDELNDWLWPKVMGPLFDEDDETLFIGIGSTLYHGVFPNAARKVVFGAGFGGYTAVPNVHDGSWRIFFVRGPRTASTLGLDRALAISDAAVLVRTQYRVLPCDRPAVSFMPHWQSMERGHWREACALAGVKLVDPRRSVDVVLDDIAQSRMLITEAMHGAIVADALRVPWIPVRPIHRAHRAKWLDWTESLHIPYNPATLMPSSSREILTRMTGRGSLGHRASALAASPVLKGADRIVVHAAAVQLRKLARTEPQLSSDRVLDAATARMMHHVELFKKEFRSR